MPRKNEKGKDIKPDNKGNTILSMFRSQVKKQSKPGSTAATSIVVSDSGSEESPVRAADQRHQRKKHISKERDSNGGGDLKRKHSDNDIVVCESNSKYFKTDSGSSVGKSKKRLSLRKSKSTEKEEITLDKKSKTTDTLELQNSNTSIDTRDKSTKHSDVKDHENSGNTKDAVVIRKGTGKKLIDLDKSDDSEAEHKKPRRNKLTLKRKSDVQVEAKDKLESDDTDKLDRIDKPKDVENSVDKSNSIGDVLMGRAKRTSKPLEKAKVSSKDTISEINNAGPSLVSDETNDNSGDNKSNSQDTNNEETEEIETTEYRVPYFLENFKTVLSCVLEDKEYVKLFDVQDMKYVEAFNNLEEPCQKLYVRLFSRKLSWLPIGKINYPEISDNIPQVLAVLEKAGLVVSGEKLDDLKIVLKILSAPDLKKLAKTLHINSQRLTKPKLIQTILKKSQQSAISTMFTGGGAGNMEKTILKRARSSMGQVCRVQEEARAMFLRVIMLFSLYNTNIDEETGTQNQLFQMLMVNIGRVQYPGYMVNRRTPIFSDRAAVVRFETALQYEMEISNLTETHKWEEALEVYYRAKTEAQKYSKQKAISQWDKGLPEFLRLYTSGSVYTRIDNQGIEILQRLKQYDKAVALLEELLKQDLYCQNYRGFWYERLALNLEAHLKSPLKSLDAIERGLADVTVRAGRRYGLYERAKRLCAIPKLKLSHRMENMKHDPVTPTPEVEIEGCVMSDAAVMGVKYQFVMQGDSDSVTLCAVEELVLQHYNNNNYPEGLHAEGSIISNLFVLLCWDLLFMDVPDAFQGPFQTCPLDIMTQDFYKNRQTAADERLAWIRSATKQELMREVEQTWTDHQGTLCIGINWDKFSSQTHQHLVSCMGGKVIAGILERFIKDPRHTRSGFPDLTLWNYDTGDLKICEVKGPNDRLSNKQILWIDFLIKLGVDAEVCYVKAVAAKKLKPI